MSEVSQEYVTGVDFAESSDETVVTELPGSRESEDPVEEPDVTEESEEASSVKAPAAMVRRKRIRNTVAHVPGPRRKRKFAERPGWDPETGTWDGHPAQVKAEEETGAEASAEAEVSDEGVVSKYETPITFGNVDG